MTIKLTVTRLKCLNQQCARRTFSGCASNEIVRNTRRTSRVAEIVRLLGHRAGGRPAERLLSCFGMVASDDTVLRCLKSRSATPAATALRGARGRAMEPSSSISNADAWWTSSPIDHLQVLQLGSVHIPPSRLSAAIGRDFAPRELRSALLKPVKSLIASI